MKIETLENIASNTKADIMFRYNAAKEAKNAFIAITLTKGVCFLYRTTTNNTTKTVKNSNLSFPCCLKLTRHNTVLTGYASNNGTKWIEVSSQTVELSYSAYVGIAVCSGKNDVLVKAIFNDFSFSLKPTSKENKLFENQISVFPNPANTYIFNTPLHQTTITLI